MPALSPTCHTRRGWFYLPCFENSSMLGDLIMNYDSNDFYLSLVIDKETFHENSSDLIAKCH